MIITSLKPTKNKRNISLFIDGRFVFSIPVEIVVGKNLKLNSQLTSRELNQLLQESYLEKLYNKSLNFLSYRPRSEKEVKMYLAKVVKKFTKITNLGLHQENLIKTVIKKLNNRRLINDQQFAQWWIKQRVTHRPKGNQALKVELAQKGIDREIITSVLLSSEKETQLAKQFLMSKQGKLKSLSFYQARSKAQQWLKSRGFSYQTIYAVIDEIIKPE